MLFIWEKVKLDIFIMWVKISSKWLRHWYIKDKTLTLLVENVNYILDFELGKISSTRFKRALNILAKIDKLRSFVIKEIEKMNYTLGDSICPACNWQWFNINNI